MPGCIIILCVNANEFWALLGTLLYTYCLKAGNDNGECENTSETQKTSTWKWLNRKCVIGGYVSKLFVAPDTFPAWISHDQESTMPRCTRDGTGHMSDLSSTLVSLPSPPSLHLSPCFSTSARTLWASGGLFLVLLMECANEKHHTLSNCSTAKTSGVWGILFNITLPRLCCRGTENTHTWSRRTFYLFTTASGPSALIICHPRRVYKKTSDSPKHSQWGVCAEV